MDKELEERLSTPEGLEAWYRQVDNEVMARASSWPAGFGGQYRVNGIGDYVSGEVMESLLPDEHLLLLYEGLANTLGCGELPSRREETLALAGRLPEWRDMKTRLMALYKHLSPKLREETYKSDDYKRFVKDLYALGAPDLERAFFDLPEYGIEDVCANVGSRGFVGDFSAWALDRADDAPVFYTDCEGPREFDEEELAEIGREHPEFITTDCFTPDEIARYTARPVPPAADVLSSALSHGQDPACGRGPAEVRGRWAQKRTKP